MRLVLAFLACCGANHPTPAPTPLALGWRADLGTMRVAYALALTDGDVLLGATFNPQTKLPDMVSVDALSAELMVLGKGGVAKPAFRVPGGKLLAIGQLGTRTVAAVLRPGWEIAMLDLDLAAGRATKETTLLTTTDAPQVGFATQGDGYVVSLGEFDGKHDKTTLIGYAADGKERWRRTLDDQITGISGVDGELAVFERHGDHVFAARAIDATGKDRELHELKVVDPDAGNGTFTQAVRDGDKLVWFGHAGGTLEVDGARHERTSTPSQPFSLTGRELVELDPHNGFVWGAGRLHGRPVAITWINPMDATKGVYATTGGQRLPIYEYTTDPSEDHETAVTGTRFHVDEVVTTPTSLVLIGRCDKTYCAQEIH